MPSPRYITRAATAALVVLLALTSAAVTPAAAAAPAICPAGQAARTIYLSDFEGGAGGGPAGWRATRIEPRDVALPATAGQLNGSHWHHPPPPPGNYPWGGQLNIWADTFPGGAVPEVAAASAIEMERAVTLPANARLTFIHRFDFTALAGGDGGDPVRINDYATGSVEFATEGGEWGDARTFSGSVPDHRSSHFDLDQFKGKRLRLRFLLALTGDPAPGTLPPAGGAFRGWSIDDVHIYRCEQGEGGDIGDSPPPEVPGSPDAVPRQLVRTAATLFVARRPSVLKRGAKASLRLAITNTQNVPFRRVRVCFRAPRRVLCGVRCTLIRRLPASSTAELVFRVRVSAKVPKRRKRLRVGFVARTHGTVVATAARRYRIAGP